MLALAAALASALLGPVAVPVDAHAQSAGAQLGGGYVGVDEAEGWRLLVAPVEVDGRAAYDGSFMDEFGASTPFVAFANGDSAEATVTFSDGQAFFRLSPRPIGLVLTWVPLDAEQNLAVQAAQTFPFLRDDVQLPSEPERLAAAPLDVSSSFSAIAFLNSYEFWTPEQAGRAYASLTDRARALIKIYAAVHTDVLWKLCQARTTPPGLFEALEGQAIDCPTLLGAIADIQQRGLFSRYKDELAPEQAALLDAMGCATGAIQPGPICIEVSRGTSQRAVSLETAASILERY